MGLFIVQLQEDISTIGDCNTMGDLVARAVDSIHLFFVLYQLKYITHTPVHVVYLSH